MNYEDMAARMVEAVKGFVSRATAPLDKRVDQLEYRNNRHSEHLARLETRLAALERKADK